MYIGTVKESTPESGVVNSLCKGGKEKGKGREGEGILYELRQEQQQRGFDKKVSRT